MALTEQKLLSDRELIPEPSLDERVSGEGEQHVCLAARSFAVRCCWKLFSRWRTVAAALPLVLCGTAAAHSQRGEQVYAQQCARCHGEAGQGTADFHPDPLVGDRSVAQLAELIAQTMPEDLNEKCPPTDAEAVAQYIYEAFYSADARLRHQPARIELARLTVRQYQNTVADLVGSFRSPADWGAEHGLRAQYNPTREFGGNPQQVERIDPEVNFDWGVDSPLPGQFEPGEFSVRWRGSVVAPDTGDYEFVVRSDQALRLWVNDLEQPLIDAYVRATSDKEFRGTIRLLGGRAYPLKLEFSKAIQGVKDDKKNKEKPRPPVAASIVLAWRRPFHSEEVVPSRCLSTNQVPEQFVLQAPFPPDDRSAGYERGTRISKAWDEATTEAAIEVAGYVASHLQELAGADPANSGDEPRLREFCCTFAERAFRQPLTDEQRQMYVVAQFTGDADLPSAVKRVLLLVLKSPRFLYREIGLTAADSYAVAGRLAYGMWDSLPDEELQRAAAAGELADGAQIRGQLARMAKDRRTRHKLRSFVLDWLNVAQAAELSKDRVAFPEFTAEVASDLRTSLELAIEELLASEAPDLRPLLTGNSIYLNGRLARVYDVQLPAGAPFQKVSFAPDERSGIASHPYLLAHLAYTGASSPIHRGVFMMRSLLGRTLQPPPVSVAPLPVDLHPDLTTRQRVLLQTSPDACQTCHTTINALGFSLEHFDAIGRYRQVEKQQLVDASGGYTTRTGESKEFDGVREVAAFLVESDELHEAFVRQLFHYAIRQPIDAYGENRLAELKQAFVAADFNVRALLQEAVAATVEPAEQREPTH